MAIYIDLSYRHEQMTCPWIVDVWPLTLSSATLTPGWSHGRITVRDQHHMGGVQSTTQESRTRPAVQVEFT
jgi:hypothetical protein